MDRTDTLMYTTIAIRSAYIIALRPPAFDLTLRLCMIGNKLNWNA